jgi:hypothetical protein
VKLKISNINWTNHLIELVVVFIGIYGAFALNNWNNSRQERNLEIKYLENLLSEIRLDNEQLLSIISNTTKDSTKIDSLLTLLKEQKVDSQKILPYLNILSSAEKFSPRNITFESIRNSGGLETISNFELKSLITENYLLYDDLVVVENVTFEFLKNNWVPFMMKHFDIINSKIVTKTLVHEVEFGNMIGGYFSSLVQQIGSYRKVQKKCTELMTALENELI